MQIQMHEMDPRFAWIKYLDYRKAVRDHKKFRIEEAKRGITESGRALRQARTTRSKIEKEDTELREAYKQMAKGKRIVNIVEAMRMAGFDRETGWLPKIAICRADAEKVKIYIPYGDQHGFHFQSDKWINSKTQNNPEDIRIEYTVAEFFNADWRKTNNLLQVGRVKALVPKIPPHLKPKDPENYYILWEPNWEVLPPPPDPILLSRIGSKLYTVVATWDMTPLEASILEAR
jgi:hypothetical protein